MTDQPEQHDVGEQPREGGLDSRPVVSPCPSESRPLLLGFATLVGPFGLAVLAGLAVARISESWVQVPLLLLSLVGIPILVALRYGRRSAWIALHVHWVVSIALTCVFGLIALSATGQALSLLLMLIAAAAQVMVISVLCMYMHTRRVKAYCSVRGPGGEVSRARAAVGVVLALTGVGLLWFWSTAYREFDVVSRSAYTSSQAMAMAETAQALPRAMKLVRVRISEGPEPMRDIEVAEQFRAGVLGHCALAGALLAGGWSLGLWHGFVSRGLHRAMLLLRGVGLAVCGILVVGAILRVPAPVLSRPTAWEAMLGRAGSSIMVEIREQGEAAIDGEVIDSDELETRLREIAQSPGGPPAVALRPQPDARCGRFVRVMNLLREIGFTRIDPGLTTPSSLAIIPPGADPFALRHGIHIDIRENGRIMCNGRRMRLDQLQSTLGKRFPSSAPPVSAIICVDPNTRFRDLRLVVDRLQRIGITDTSLDLVLPVEVTTKPTLSPEPRSEELLR